MNAHTMDKAAFLLLIVLLLGSVFGGGGVAPAVWGALGSVGVTGSTMGGESGVNNFSGGVF
jgi:hypothetical protein